MDYGKLYGVLDNFNFDLAVPVDYADSGGKSETVGHEHKFDIQDWPEYHRYTLPLLNELHTPVTILYNRFQGRW